MEDVSKTFRDKDTCIRYILAHYPEARSNDKLLMVTFWQMFDKIPITASFRKAFLQRATTPETITRARRHVQEKGSYHARDEVREYREARRKKLRDFFSGS